MYRDVGCSLGGSLVKAHRLEFHYLDLLAHLLNGQHFCQPKRLPAKETLDVLPLDKRNVLSKLRLEGIHESLCMRQLFIPHGGEHFCGLRIIRFQPVAIVTVNAGVVLLEGNSQS